MPLYVSPKKKVKAARPQFIDERSRKSGGFTKISERKARTRPEAPWRTIEDIKKDFQDSLKNQPADVAKDGTRFQQCLHNPSQEDCGAFFGDGGFNGDGGFGDAMDLENEGWLDDEEESLEGMPFEKLCAKVKYHFKMDPFEKTRPYAGKLSAFKENWNEFIDCVTGEMAWSPLQPPAGVRPCDCNESKKMPAVSWDGTSLL